MVVDGTGLAVPPAPPINNPITSRAGPARLVMMTFRIAPSPAVAPGGPSLLPAAATTLASFHAPRQAAARRTFERRTVATLTGAALATRGQSACRWHSVCYHPWAPPWG